MKEQLRPEQLRWAETTFEKVREKLHAECQRMGDRIPNIPVNGVYPDNGAADLCDWVNGFWAAVPWPITGPRARTYPSSTGITSWWRPCCG